ncbi:unnamed protein product [Mycena citricolor]|uniref:Fatty acid desaturase domain-containing protein n=1 Tax=Mycena citricolor TaxID=2018698 RepID=A0AAD2H293_9AGAR|nr:unnamed protein product [Mycena citricolor]
MFSESPEYIKRRGTPFSPPTVSSPCARTNWSLTPRGKITWKELRAVIPSELFRKSTFRGMTSVVQDVVCFVTLFALSRRIDAFAAQVAVARELTPGIASVLKWSLWSAYWGAQSIVMAGCWCLGHEAGHHNISPYGIVNDTVGFILHTALLTPYFAWKQSHHAHHKGVGSVERDDIYVPRTKSQLGITTMEQLHEMFEETPLYTLVRMLVMQLLGYQAYLLFNALGSPQDPPGTNASHEWLLLVPEDFWNIVLSDAGIVVVLSIVMKYGIQVGAASLFKQLIIPYLLCHHWVVMMTYLQHSDPTLPHYRRGQWTFLRGSLATVDRPLLGFIGRMCLHNVSHDHVGHHLFSSIPYYNQPEVTKRIKAVLGEHYNEDSTNTFYALYRSFTNCCYIEEDGDVVMYSNGKGEATRGIVQDLGNPRENDAIPDMLNSLHAAS